MNRTPPDADEYSVIGCSDCDNLQIVQGAPKTTECARCGEQLTFKTLKKFYTTKDKEAAINARALKLAARAGNEEQFKQLLEAGALDPDAVRAVTDKEYLEKLGMDPAITDDEGTPSPPDAVMDGVETLNDPTVDQLLDHITARESLSEEQLREAIDRLQQRGDIIKRPDGTLVSV